MHPTLAVLGRLIDYEVSIVALARREIRQWATAAAAIPDPTLRRLATEAIAIDARNAEAAAAFAVTAPRHLRRTTVELLVAQQLLLDYVDIVGEQIAELQCGLALSSALPATISSPERALGFDPFNDGGYLVALTAICHRRLRLLPSASAVEQQAEVAATRCAEALARTHTAARSGDIAQLRRWASMQASTQGYAWWEIAAGGNSNLALLALLAAAADPATTHAYATEIASAYWPHVCAMSTLLDSVVDHERDATCVNFSFVSHYPGPDATRAGLIHATRLSLTAVRPLRHSHIHTMIVCGVAGYYAASATPGSLAAEVAPSVIGQLGRAATPIVVALRARHGRPHRTRPVRSRTAPLSSRFRSSVTGPGSTVDEHVNTGGVRSGAALVRSGCREDGTLRVAVRQRLFIGGSREALDICRAVQAELCDEFAVQVWDQDVFRLSYSALDSLLEVLDSSDAGIFVLHPDDVTISRDTPAASVRDNVIFELGMFIGRLGRDRTFMLAPGTDRPKLPSDLHGITTAVYDGGPIPPAGRRAAVASACTKIRDTLRSVGSRVVQEPEARERLDRAMARMSRDLELLFSEPGTGSDEPNGSADQSLPVTARIGRTQIRIELGRIETYSADDSVVALPANEYFDDDCVADLKSSLGAYVQQHFGDALDRFDKQVRAELAGLPSQRVPRGERRVDDSYGIGRAIFLRGLLPEHRIILVSATTERAAVGLRAEPHFLYAAMQGVIETMNANRRYSLVMPVLGSGHGGMPVTVALLFNLLAVRSCLTSEGGLRLDELRIIVFDSAAAEVTRSTVDEVLLRAGAATA